MAAAATYVFRGDFAGIVAVAVRILLFILFI
jgi:hypothetical protein